MKHAGWWGVALAIAFAPGDARAQHAPADAGAGNAADAGSPPAAWATQCAARLARVQSDLAAAVPWIAHASIEVRETSPWAGWYVMLESDNARVLAFIEDYPGAAPTAAWDFPGLGECPDESAPRPQVSEFRNFRGRQAQLTLRHVPRRQVRAVMSELHAALEDCGTLP